MDGDSAADLIAVGTDFADVPNDILLVWLANGDGRFQDAPAQSLIVTVKNSDPALGLALADSNYDGALDSAVSDPKTWNDGSNDADNPRGLGRVSIHLGGATLGHFSPSRPFRLGLHPSTSSSAN